VNLCQAHGNRPEFELTPAASPRDSCLNAESMFSMTGGQLEPKKLCPQRWFSCIVMNYFEGGGFWDRDAGLLYQGFRRTGIDSRFVALGEPHVDEDRGLILASRTQMETPAWWKQWGLDGVVLYSWALPRYTPIASAIKQAGARLLILLDTDGVMLPQVWFWRYLQLKYYYAKSAGSYFPGLTSVLKAIAAMPKARYQALTRHLEYADFVGLPSPISLQRYARFLLAIKRPDLVQKLRLVHHPASSDMRYDPGTPKAPVIIAVGGWDRLVKGGELLVRVLDNVLSREPAYSGRIVGSGETLIRKLVEKLPKEIHSRIEITGPISHNRIAAECQKSQIAVNTSTSESFGIACAEALCCGCSVVGHALIGSMIYFCSASSGTLASTRSLGNYTDALLAEIHAWRSGERDPVQISNTWTRRLHVERIAEAVVNLR